MKDIDVFKGIAWKQSALDALLEIIELVKNHFNIHQGRSRLILQVLCNLPKGFALCYHVRIFDMPLSEPRHTGLASVSKCRDAGWLHLSVPSLPSVAPWVTWQKFIWGFLQ